MSKAEPSRIAPRGRAPSGLGRWLVPVLFGGSLVVLLVLVIPYFRGDPADKLDADLCPLEPDAATTRAVLLIDLRKPVDPLPHLPASVFLEVAGSVDVDAELHVFAVADDPLAPRASLGRICKPYANDELVAPAAKDRPGPRDCDDLPAQLPTRLRGRAQLYCDRRAEIEREITTHVAQTPRKPVANAYLVEAIDDTRLELAETGRAATLHVFSDMMQHASWYSHLEREPDDWSALTFTAARRSRAALLAEPPPTDALGVRVHYVPRRGTTEHPRVGRAHKNFWRDYFADAETLVFDDLPPLAGYEVEPLTPPQEEPAAESPAKPVEETQAASEEREEAARLLELVQAERAALERAREQAAAEAQQLDARAAELNRREEALAQANEEVPAEPLEVDEQVGTSEPPPRPAVAQTFDPVPEVDAVEGSLPTVAVAQPSEPPAAVPPPVDACPTALRPGVAAAAEYPNGGWTNYGSADVAVSYTIDDYGETIDDQVSVTAADSSSDFPRYMPLFATAAEDLVRNWAFEFTATDACLKRQQRVTIVRFRYRR